MTQSELGEAVAAHRVGDFARARTLYESVLRADPREPDALNMLGLLAQQSGDLARARALIEESVALRPDAARSQYNLAIVRALQDDVAGAIVAYEAAISAAPDFAAAYSNLGNLYAQTGRREDALFAYAAAIRAKPDFGAVYSNLATVLIALERFDEAILVLEAALRLAPQTFEVYANLGQAYRRNGRAGDALIAMQRALAVRPDRDAYINLGVEALNLDDFGVARDANLQAIALDPTSAQARTNLAWVYHLTGRYSESIAACEAAISLQPDAALAHVNRAVSLLVCGEFVRGWEEYGWTWRVPSRRPQYPYLDRAQLWDGETFADRTLLITRDQGFGDAIQMVRYLPAVKARGGRVVFEVAAALAPLFNSLPGCDELRVHSDDTTFAERIDLHIPLLGLPRAFRMDLHSIPAPISVRVPPERIERWRSRLRRPGLLRVGIVWAGDREHANDRRRSVRLEDFAALGAIEGIAWFGLQKDREEARTACGLLAFDPLGAEIGDFADTAAIVTHLDLVIAVDTSIVHLAGTLGKPVWTLLPFAPDWRWLLGRQDSPWYPTMRLFRQPRPGDWAAVFAAVDKELRAYARSRIIVA